jgi:aspartyl-tRNA(Asn)/glutamyl-tRNA(Gln) amidotransferase subunit A
MANEPSQAQRVGARRWSRRDFAKTGMTGLAGTMVMRTDVESKGNAPSEAAAQGDLVSLSLSEASELVRTRKVSPVDLVQGCLDRIARLNPTLNAFITITADTARAQAKEAEASIQRGGWKGPLHGIPVALKDLVDTAGVATTAASGVYRERIPTQDAEIVRRLKEAGAVLVGKLNMHEFAYGGSTVISAFGPVRNPWAPARSAGGSSAGSAAAVAAGMCFGAIGSDTGGSIRQPAAYCGIVGLKPTFGRVSTRGVIPLAWSLDHVGPMTRSVRDAAHMLHAIAGHDPADPTSLVSPVDDYPAALDRPAKARLGIPRPFFFDDLHADIAQATDAALGVLARLTSSQRDVTISSGNDAALRVLQAEAWAYHELTVARSPELYSPETLKRIRAGASLTASAYIAARRTLDDLRRSANAIFDQVDLLVTPTTPTPPLVIADLLADLDGLRAKEVVTLRNTRWFNALGLPAISVPCGFTSDGLPIGLQIIGRAGADAQVLSLAHAYERNTSWHKRQPNVG